MQTIINFKKFFFGLCFALLITSAQATVITFDDRGLVNDGTGNGEVIGNEYADLGVLFSTNGIALNLGGTTGSTPNSLGADALSTNDFDGNLTVLFTDGLSYTDVSFTIFNTPFEASAFGADDSLLATITSGLDFSQFFDFSGFAVNRIEISGDFYAIDDLSFNNVSAVPVPAAAWLFGSALLGFFGFSRKKANA